jgi:hypothetical protein
MCVCTPRNIGEQAFQKLQKMTKIGIFTFFVGLKILPKNLFWSFLTKIDVNQPKEQKKNSKMGTYYLRQNYDCPKLLKF